MPHFFLPPDKSLRIKFLPRLVKEFTVSSKSNIEDRLKGLHLICDPTRFPDERSQQNKFAFGWEGNFWIYIHSPNYILKTNKLPISNRVDTASAAEAVDSGSIPDRVKTKTIEIGIHSFPPCRSAIKGTM